MLGFSLIAAAALPELTHRGLLCSRPETVTIQQKQEPAVGRGERAVENLQMRCIPSQRRRILVKVEQE